MRKLLMLAIAGTIGATALAATPAAAQRYGDYGYGSSRHYNNDYRRELRECRRELRRADSRREYYRELRECRRELREARRDHYRDRYDRYDRRYRRY